MGAVMANWTKTRLNLQYHWKALLVVLVGVLVGLGLFSWPVSAQEPEPAPEPYPWDTGGCEEGECPTRYVIEGFDVYISPTVYEAPDFTHAALGRELDLLTAQLVWITSHNAVPKPAVQQLIDSGVSIYLDTASEWSEWWPCGRGDRGAACYNAALNRIGIAVFGAHWPFRNKHGMAFLRMDHTQQAVVLHELAHAFHAHVVAGGNDNICIKNTYEQSKHLYRAVEESEQITQNRYDGRPIHRRAPETAPVMTPHYATTNAFEYFAEASEAMWAFNGQYPWNRNELWQHDRAGYLLTWNAWHNPTGFCPEQSVPPPQAVPK